jgi:tRNA-specific 2-thiouridylase
MRTRMRNNRVVLGLSGGVDSTAATLLLKEKGYNVTGLFFDVLGNQEKEAEKAKKLAEQLDIDFIYKDVSSNFSNEVIRYFCESYIEGRTPNPCIKCNPQIKFKVLLEAANSVDAYYISTGHYANIVYDEQFDRYFIHKGHYIKKDQSYMLYRLNQDILSRLLLPLGTIESKDRVRAIVKQEDLPSADAEESQEICFVKDDNYIRIIEQSGYESKPGDFLDLEGNVIGRHRGIIYYTIGQRKGLGQTFGKPMYVVKIDPINNTVTLGDNGDLFNNEVYAEDVIFTLNDSNSLPAEYANLKIQAKVRYTAQPSDAYLHQIDEGIRVEFIEPQRAPTPGQSVVFYQDDRVIGGGIIRS